jgi:hypothetical protein
MKSIKFQPTQHQMAHHKSEGETEDEIFEKDLAIRRKLAIEAGGAFEDPGLDAWLTELEQEPGHWEDLAALAERHWPSKKNPKQDGEKGTGTAPTSAPEN